VLRPRIVADHVFLDCQRDRICRLFGSQCGDSPTTPLPLGAEGHVHLTCMVGVLRVDRHPLPPPRLNHLPILPGGQARYN